MSRTWDENEYQGGLGDLADDETAFHDDGTVDLGAGSEGGRYNVTDDGHTISDEELQNSDEYVYTGNDTAQRTEPVPDGAAVAQERLRELGLAGDDSESGGNQTMLLLAAAAAAAAIYVLGVRD